MNPSGFLDSGDIRRLKRSLDITAFYQFPVSFGVLPDGGNAGEVLTKNSNTDLDVSWQPGGGSGTMRYASMAKFGGF